MVKLNMTGVHWCMVSRPMAKPTPEAKLFVSIKKTNWSLGQMDSNRLQFGWHNTLQSLDQRGVHDQIDQVLLSD